MASRATKKDIFWYQDTGYPVHRCVCMSVYWCIYVSHPTPPHPSPPHPTPPQVAWWCDVRMCDLWWYGGEVADRIDNTLDRLEGSADFVHYSYSLDCQNNYFHYITERK